MTPAATELRDRAIARAPAEVGPRSDLEDQPMPSGGKAGAGGGAVGHLIAPPTIAVAGAAIFGSQLAVVAIGGSTGRPVLLRDATFVLRLPGRTQVDLRSFRGTLDECLLQAKIATCLLRGAADSGPFKGKGAAFRIEAALQLSPHVAVSIVPGSALTRWLRDCEPVFPVMPAEVSSLNRRVLEQATGAALCALHRPEMLADPAGEGE